MELVTKVVICYLLVVNIALFIMMGLDKSRARKHEWRIPEKRLLTLGVIGGGLGGLISQQVFRHKTQKPKFWLAFIVGTGVLVLAIWLAS